MTASSARLGASMAMVSMCCVQIGLAVSVSMIDQVGALGAAWLRLFWAGVVFLVLVRPGRRTFSPAPLRSGTALGLVTAGMTLLFMAAVDRLPLGTASALEFLGPLGVALCRSHGRARAWALVAGAGVACLTRPWTGSVDTVGVGFALGAAVCWAAYILLTQRVGDAVAGVNGLAISMPVAALAATPVALPGLLGRLTPGLLLAGLGMAILLPVLPFALEMLALRRLAAGAFGTLMALEPAFALAIGFVALRQAPSAAALGGIALVVLAGAGAERSGMRTSGPAPDAEAGRDGVSSPGDHEGVEHGLDLPDEQALGQALCSASQGP